jgi:hypothetical protein
MLLQRRAQYNLLQLPQDESEVIESLEPWQIEDYRKLPDQEIIKTIEKLGLKIPSLEGFASLAEEFESPDDMTQVIASELEAKTQDRLYLNLFELWRRHLPEKRCPSVFCDELDYQIRQFSQNPDAHAEELEDILNYFLQILDSHMDEGADPQALFSTFQTYCATSLESFLFQYILREVELGEYEYAFDLIQGFYPYLNDPLWFNYLMARAQMLVDPKEGTEVLAQVIEHVENLELAEEILLYLSKERNHPLFCALSSRILNLIDNEEDFQEFLECTLIHFNQMGLQEPAEEINSLLESRKRKRPSTALSQSDPGLKSIQALLEKWNQVL